MQKLHTRDFSSIDEALQHFISSAGDQAEIIASCCLACAGPVVDNTCAMTNLKWVVDGEAISQMFGMRTAVWGPPCNPEMLVAPLVPSPA